MAVMAADASAQQQWPVHSMDRPRPPIVTPAPEAPPVPPPSDAIVLFSGNDLNEWHQGAGQAPRWAVRDGYVEVVPNTGSLETRRAFGDIQLHIEWRTPSPPTGEGQGRGNSGVFLMDRYEVQVLDSYQNITYADGQAAAMYGQHPPMVNASRPPGQWQTYDIIFRRPRFTATGRLRTPGRMTVFHNGVLVHDNARIEGVTAHRTRARYSRHDDRLPLSLQDHGDLVRFRNVWVRELE